MYNDDFANSISFDRGFLGPENRHSGGDDLGVWPIRRGGAVDGFTINQH